NSNGVDLNRNFPSVKEFGLPDYTIYQPENLAQMNFLRNIYMVMGANIHDGAEVVNYPFDTWKSLHADNEWFILTSREYADEAQKRSYPVLYMSGFDDGITNGWVWYDVDGGRQDWVNYFIHGREVTLEINWTKHPPPTELPYFWYYNYPSMLRYMEQSLFGIQGIILDESTGEPIKASIRVMDHDTLHSDVYSDSLSGYFARLIEPGTWVLEISAPGFDSVVVTGVQVHPDQATWLDVSLIPSGYGVNVRDGLELSPNPFIYQAALTIPVSVPGPHRIYLYNIRGQMVLEDLMFCEMTGIFVYSLEGSHLDQGIYLLKLISPTDTRTLKIFKSQ
ncbi:MAG: carboxypeptidase regulatory-like domain-containing protein, partial [Bacteroidales bacterium]|nr:carboxypeptidase regulatory-like domain-containing protein [Bacteroidales bacterium]